MDNMTPEKQLSEWVKGNPFCPNDRGECCPDFSCCNPKLLAPEDVRRKFLDADQATREGMCMHFLGAGIASLTDEPEKVYVAGQGVEQ